MEIELQDAAQLMFRHSESNIILIEANYHINSLVSLKNNIMVVCNEIVPVKAASILKKECCRLGLAKPASILKKECCRLGFF